MVAHTCKATSNSHCAGCAALGIKKPFTCTVCGGYIMGGGCTCRKSRAVLEPAGKVPEGAA